MQYDHEQGGFAVILVLVMTMVLGGLATTFLLEANREHEASLANQLEMEVFKDAENALNYNYVLLQADPLYPVKDVATFKVNAAESLYEGPERDLVADGAPRARVRLGFQYRNGGTPVVFADRADPKDQYDRIFVHAWARKRNAERELIAIYEFQLAGNLGGAIISDSVPSGSTGLAPKAQAQTGDVVLAGKGRDGQHYIFGDMKANGAIRYYSDKSETGLMDSGSASSWVGALDGDVSQSLASTPEEVPDFTQPGGDDQLFDFARFIAAANAGSGQVFTSLASFASAMNAANDIGQPLEGIIVLDLDVTAEGSNPKLADTGSEKNGMYLIPGGINIRGTLLFNFSEGAPDKYKVFINTPLRINAGDLSSLNPADESTYTTGYPPKFSDPTKAPWNAVITPTYDNFTTTSDLPALMFNTGIVDIHDEANICGVVYGPSFIEIENTGGNTQYFNGSIIGGAGILLQGHSTTGFTAVKFDRNAVKNLETKDNKGKAFTRTGFILGK